MGVSHTFHFPGILIVKMHEKWRILNEEIARRRERRMTADRDCALILLYHRVLHKAWDPADIAVHPDLFYDQLQWLKRHYTVLPLPELLALWKSGHTPHRTVAITFDDGYADNATTVLPILETLQLPATFFISDHLIDSQERYYWDWLTHLTDPGNRSLFPEEIPARLTRTEAAIRISKDPLAAYWQLWQAFHDQTWAGQQALTRDYAQFLGDHFSTLLVPGDRFMSLSELRTLAAHPLAHLGAHTVHHPNLTRMTCLEITQEITENIQRLAGVTNQLIDCLAYPFGLYNSAVVEAAAETGIAFACTTQPRPLSNRITCPYHIPRVSVPNAGPAALDLYLKRYVRFHS